MKVLREFYLMLKKGFPFYRISLMNLKIELDQDNKLLRVSSKSMDKPTKILIICLLAADLIATVYLVGILTGWKFQ